MSMYLQYNFLFTSPNNKLALTVKKKEKKKSFCNNHIKSTYYAFQLVDNLKPFTLK